MTQISPIARIVTEDGFRTGIERSVARVNRAVNKFERSIHRGGLSITSVKEIERVAALESRLLALGASAQCCVETRISDGVIEAAYAAAARAWLLGVGLRKYGLVLATPPATNVLEWVAGHRGSRPNADPAFLAEYARRMRLGSSFAWGGASLDTLRPRVLLVTVTAETQDPLAEQGTPRSLLEGIAAAIATVNGVACVAIYKDGLAARVECAYVTEAPLLSSGASSAVDRLAVPFLRAVATSGPSFPSDRSMFVEVEDNPDEWDLAGPRIESAVRALVRRNNLHQAAAGYTTCACLHSGSTGVGAGPRSKNEQVVHDPAGLAILAPGRRVTRLHHVDGEQLRPQA